MNWNHLRIISAFKAYCPPNWHWVNSGNKEFTFNLWLVLRGRGHIQQDSQLSEIVGGQCYLFREWRPHVASHDPKEPLIVPYIEFEFLDDQNRPYRPDEQELPSECRRVDDSDFVAKLMERSITAHLTGDKQGAFQWLRAALSELERQDARPVHSPAEQRQHDMVAEVCNHIRQYPERHFTVPELASDAGYSTDHFIRVFRKFQNCTPGDFQIRCRVQAAAQILRFTTHSITEVADSLGYPDIYSFSKQFRKIVGISPRSYREGQ